MADEKDSVEDLDVPDEMFDEGIDPQLAADMEASMSDKDSEEQPEPPAKKQPDEKVEEAKAEPASEPEKIEEPASEAVETEPEKKAEEPYKVPLPELLETRKRAQEAETQVTALKAQNEAFQRQLDGLQQAVLNNKQAAQPTPEPIDPYENPTGFADQLRNELTQGFQAQLLNMSQAAANRTYGAEVVNAAISAAQTSGALSGLMNDPDPAGAIVEWHKQQQVIQTTGGDLEGYKAKLRDELKAEILAEIGAVEAPGAQNGTVQPQQPAHPPSLNRVQTSGNSVEPILTDEEAFKHMPFATTSYG